MLMIVVVVVVVLASKRRKHQAFSSCFAPVERTDKRERGGGFVRLFLSVRPGADSKLLFSQIKRGS